MGRQYRRQYRSSLHYEVHINGEPVDPVYFFFNDLNAEQYDRVLKIAATGSAKSFD